MTGSSRTRTGSSPRSASRFSYPLFLDLSGKPCVVVGGGRVAERKCSSLLKAGAKVTVVSPALTKGLERYRIAGRIAHIKRQYRRSDIRSAFLVIAATDSEDVNRAVAHDAAALNRLLNVVDNPGLCNCIVPSVVKRGLLTIAVSTGGASPAMAKAIRKELEELYGPEFGRFLQVMKKIRSRAMKELPDPAERERFLKRLAEEIFRR